MNKKGGNKVKYIESQQILLICMIVLNVIVVMLCLVYLGMQLVKREEYLSLAEAGNAEHIEVMRALRYDTIGVANYKSSDAIDDGSELLKGKIDGRAEYEIIESQTEFEEMMGRIRSKSHNAEELMGVGVDADFFETGCVIALAVEDNGLETVNLNKIVRDEYYNVTLTASHTSNDDIDGVYGSIIIMKLDNVIPSKLNLDIRKN